MALSAALVTSLGVSPAGKTVTFTPNTDFEIDFYIINSERNNMQISVGGVGELSDMMFFDQQIITLTESDDKVPFRLILKLPAGMEPGIRTSNIKLTPILPENEDDMLSAYLAPQIPIKVRVPYPSKYADISIVVQSVDEGTPVPIYIEFDNLGSERITSAGAELRLYDPEGELISEMAAPEISIEKDSLGKTKAEPAPILRRGIYRVVADAYYDGVDKVIDMNISLGDPLLTARELLTKQLEIQPVSKVGLKAYNDWNAELSVTGFLEIEDKKTEMPVFKFEKNAEQEISSFLETSGLEPGEYNLTVTWVYANQMKRDVFPVKIIEKKPEPAISWPRILIGLAALAVMIATLAILLALLKRKKPRTN
ncbi:hypothetical protein JXB28_03410 [Candidatus Woesearchaeota archaeon]|nr:hypothetical protein [Candidatus Woesearchaeota archaeon]